MDTRITSSRAAAALLGILATACTQTVTTSTPSPSPAQSSATSSAIPLAAWAGPYGGVPQFDRVKVPDLKPQLEAAMAENLGEIERIANDPAAPTFENTIVAMERAGNSFDRVSTIYGIWSSTMNGPEFQPVQREMAPKLAAFSDQISQNAPLFKRIEAVYNSPEKSRLTPEQQRLTWLYYTNFVRAGAKLDATAKARLSEINQKLAGLYTQFSQNVLADEGDQLIELKSEAELAGLPQSIRDAAAAAAVTKGKQGSWVITNTRSSMDPFLTYSSRRDLREKAFKLWANRGDQPGARDNNKIISDILALRAERAKLLGYQTHAHWRLENAMTKTPERALDLLEAVWKPAVQRVKEEVADMQKLARDEGQNITIEPWDYRYYAEKVRKAKYDLDQNEVKPYLQLEKKHIGLWYFDPYAREGKRSGAWMNAYRRQQRFNGAITTIVSNNSNFVKGKPGEPVLISWDDATTLFHEFGHALHGLSSNVNYPALAGTAVARDYVEFPSQLLEAWVSTPQVLQKFATHYQTGQPLPQALVDKIRKASTFNQGFATIEYLASALIDMKMHLAGDKPIDARAFERETLASMGMPREIIMRHRSPHFLHVFASDGYSAGYYSYLWSDVLTADAAGAFTEAGGLYDPAVAKRLRDYIFSVGNTMDPAEAYRQFRGRDPRVEALMRKRGFVSDAMKQ